jgi:hypothetical protein
VTIPRNPLDVRAPQEAIRKLREAETAQRSRMANETSSVEQLANELYDKNDPIVDDALRYYGQNPETVKPLRKAVIAILCEYIVEGLSDE